MCDTLRPDYFFSDTNAYVGGQFECLIVHCTSEGGNFADYEKLLDVAGNSSIVINTIMGALSLEEAMGFVRIIGCCQEELQFRYQIFG